MKDRKKRLEFISDIASTKKLSCEHRVRIIDNDMMVSYMDEIKSRNNMS